ncbi:hypothetical protein PHYSODRAFT_331097 [Phytophthora sojae]|uniref:Uncharacterized protein n=1 Tax=Phytophthora sojae (strain P6497) TaxID=1094619 RepID=G4ZG13_PHYSP|nr:hypothetical protein PHYSODRAFT_331097 [Phytophthora sojae]EGZ17080.1 hypothetical protein PHYSODRAFT_331097 [Phytophthora sojae]|eukprot:XP_009526138.1 hypothetical protein PHYSODRAFT_331097 [Phytophthora sojae]
MPFTLQSVTIVLRNERGADALTQVGPLISQFIGPSPELSLSAACSFRSTTLLDWIWGCSCPTQHDSAASASTDGWTLTRFLRSDEFYSRWQFAEVAHVAVERSDTELLQWLFDHFQDPVVPSDVVSQAVHKGDLALLQFLANTSPGVKVEWYPTVVQDALQVKQLETAHWLHQHAPLGTMTDQVREWMIKAAMHAGDLEFCASLLPKGRCVLDYADFCATPAMIEWKLDCGYFQRDWAGAGAAIHALAGTDRLDLIRRIAGQHDPPPQHLDLVGQWRYTLSEAFRHGNLDVIKFLVDHPTGQQTINEMGRSRELSSLMCFPAAKGNIKAMQYLHDEGAGGPFEQAMERYPRLSKIPEYCFMDEAATRGRIDMLPLFQSVEPSEIPGLFTPASPPPLVEAEDANGSTGVTVYDSDRHRKIIPKRCRYRDSWAPTDPMDDAAANGKLAAVQWLHVNRTEGGTTAAMDEAAANGYLDVVKWLHANRSEVCSSNAMDFAAKRGQLKIVQWLHANTAAGCTTAAMDLAAAGGNMKTLEWLFLNRSEGCTVQGIERAVSNGHLNVASWLMRRFPELNPASFNPLLLSKNKFEVLLFLHVHQPEAFTPDFVRSARLPITELTPSDVQIQNWLKLHYPVPDTPQLAGGIPERVAQQIARQQAEDFI